MTREQKLEAALREAGPLVIAHYEDFIFGPCGIPNVTAEILRVVRLGMTALATPPDTDTRVVSVELLRAAMTEWSNLCDDAEDEYGGHALLDRSYIAKIRAIIEGKDQ